MIFLKLQQVLYKWNFFRFGQILFSILKVSIDHLFYNLESGKKVLFWEKVLNFESKNLYESWTRVLWNPWFPALLETVFLTELHQIKKSYLQRRDI